MTDRKTVYKAISELDASDELKEILRMLIRFADYEDEKLFSKIKREEIAGLQSQIDFLKEG